MAPPLPRPDALRRRLAALLAGAGAAACWGLLPAPAQAQGASAAVGATAPHPAQPVGAKPAWADLSPVNQRILAPLQPLWDSLPELNRHKWLRIAARYPKYSPAEQARLQARMAEWVRMTPQQRRLARENYQITRSLPTEKKAEAWDKYQQLPEEQKKKLAAADHVPRRPGAVSALPSGKRLPSDTSRQLRHEHKAGAGHAAHPASEGAALPAAAATAVAAASAPAAATPATPASAALPAASAPATAAVQATTEATAAASDATVRQ
ncbi:MULTISPECIES: DUF3106 domain-containing protein [Cupriavidus]|uniref:DUF3106 domain-containing protein n=1 Tax=Cupriavidus TaxID=106589 RepID=UPI000E130DF1|nr:MULTISPECIES: DUF3106 domain-containing protein [Cupriavidus]MEC3765118.1 DUF3106 domain-containing protein [Cupriavidus sp. SS-3]SOY90444.1 putative lipoprotein [Cupriavidus taiwanensis]SOY91328.1 putative lipoprotein [Cupriavidus taiwanensis]